MTTTDPTPPRTPAEALRWVADMAGTHGNVTGGMLRRWADELDTAPPVYQLPAEPPPHITELWDRDGCRWEWSDGEDGSDSGWVPDTGDGVWEWPELLVEHGPLSTTPPAGTEAEQP